MSAIATIAPQVHAAQGTWTAAPSETVNGGPAFGLWLLTDGSVLSHSNALNHWCKLVPDANGSYANGTWVQLANSAYARGGATEHVLKDGRFLEAGGEYIYAWPTGGSSADQNTVEIYDPVANTWTLQAPGLAGIIGDTSSATLADGTLFYTNYGNNNGTQIYNPVTNTWAAKATKPNNGSGWVGGVEESMASLQNGGVFALSEQTSAVYDPASNTWTSSGALPFSTTSWGDIGGIAQLFDGRVFAMGIGVTGLFTPGSTPTTAGTWTAGPALPHGNDFEDEYCVTEPNGKVMFVTYPAGGSPNSLAEFDPTTNTITEITPPPDTVGVYPVSYVNLPNGQVMVCCGGLDWLYTPNGAPSDSWRPTVSSVAANSDGSYTLTGAQLSGLVNGADEGDDMTMAQNYPIVSLTNSTGKVWYCTSYAFSTMMPKAGSAAQTCKFRVPSGLAAGAYSLYVSSVGVKSKTAYSFTTASNYTLVSSPPNLSINQGSNKTDLITITRSGGFTGSVALTATGLPSGVTASFSPATVTSSGSTSTLTLTASSTATVGSATVTVNGTNGSTVHATTIALTIVNTAPPSPTAFWKYDESSGTSAADASGNSHTGTVTGGTWTTASKVGTHALSLAGAGYMSAASGVINTSSSFTVACWAELNNTSAYEDFLTVDGANVSAFYLQYNAGNGKISFNRLASDSVSAASTIAAASAAPSTGTWYHVVGVYDATAQTISLYINGALQQTASFTTPWNGTGSLLVGRGLFSGNATDYLNGVVDNARVYNSALTAAQVSTLYSSGG
ncbi:LamG domain-containing protein [Capsulimonas corticalis]|nr:LamG domain-containing protein [Capsulimonas corticalis]